MKRILLALPLLALAATADAALPSYPDKGNINPLDYSFTAAATGDLIAYFGGATAAYTSLLGVMVNGVDRGILGLNNHTAALGESLNFGSVEPGDELVFFIHVTDTDDYFYSRRDLNQDGITHIYAALYAGGDYGIPAGIYVGFEDKDITCRCDLDYDDLMFVFTNSRPVSEPGSLALLGLGLAGLGVARRRAKG